MRNSVIYFLTTLFLLFLVESRFNAKTVPTNFSTQVSHQIQKKANQVDQSSAKFSVQQTTGDIDNFSLELTEENFQLSDTFEAVMVFASVFGLIYIFVFSYKERLKCTLHSILSDFSSVKRFILIRSIRI